MSTILYIDQDVNSHLAFERLAKTVYNGGIFIQNAYSLEEGLITYEHLGRQRKAVDVIFIDVPQRESYVISTLANYTRHTPIILVSSSMNTLLREDKQGAHVCIEKPFSRRDLVALIRAFLSHSGNNIYN